MSPACSQPFPSRGCTSPRCCRSLGEPCRLWVAAELRVLLPALPCSSVGFSHRSPQGLSLPLLPGTFRALLAWLWHFLERDCAFLTGYPGQAQVWQEACTGEKILPGFQCSDYVAVFSLLEFFPLGF